jgi:hypothetical protein
VEAVQAAMKGGVRMMEVEFPISPDKIDVSLGTAKRITLFSLSLRFLFCFLVCVAS